MECNKWQEEGLLYISKELDGSGKQLFENHMELCPACRGEVEQYRFDASNFFKESLIGESPSEKINQKIIAACSQAPVLSTGFGLFSGFLFKKAIISTIFLIFGMSAGVYFTVNYFSGSSASASASSLKKPAVSQASSAAVMAKANDSSATLKADSIKGIQSALQGDSHRTPIDAQQQGIITVDLKKDR